MSDNENRPAIKLDTECMERLADTFETSAKRWELVVYPAMVAFIVLAIYGFYLIYMLSKDVHQLSLTVLNLTYSVDQNLGAINTSVGQMDQNMLHLTQSVASLSQDVNQMNENMLVMTDNINTMTSSVTNMTQNVAAMTQNTNSMAHTTYRMQRNMRDMSGPMSMFSSFFP